MGFFISLFLNYFLGAVKYPKLRFLFNSLLGLIIVSFYYYIDYDSGIEINLELDNAFSQEQLESLRLRHFFYFYGAFALFALWQFNKWVVNGKLNALRRDDIECDGCGYIHSGKYHYCPNCNQENFELVAIREEKAAKKQGKVKVTPSKVKAAPQPKQKKVTNPNDSAF